MRQAVQEMKSALMNVDQIKGFGVLVGNTATPAFAQFLEQIMDNPDLSKCKVTC